MTFFVTQVQRLVELQACVETTATAHDQQVLSRRILGLEREVDDLIERMYELSEAEVAQVVRYLTET